jgi:uncharacterized membrane protein YfcA
VDPSQLTLLALAGVVAGTVNAVAGAGSLLTFPTLLAAGLSPLSANVTNCVGLIPGSLSAAHGMRDLLRGRRAVLLRLCGWAFAGALLGAAALLLLPSSAFDRVVPVLVGAAGLLVLAQPHVVRRVGRTGASSSAATGPAVGAVAVYSGYFGAAQGVMYIGALGVLTPAPLAEVNATKNVLAVAANGAAALVYAFAAPVEWTAVLALAAGSVCGGPLGAVLARRIPAGPLRIGIAVLALAVAARLAWTAWG